MVRRFLYLGAVIAVLLGRTVASANVFGWQGGYTVAVSLGNAIRGSQFRSGDSGMATSISVYLVPEGGAEALKVKCALYECDSAGTALTLIANGQTEERTLNTSLGSAWYKFEFIHAKPYLTNRWYSPVVWAEAGAVYHWQVACTTVTSGYMTFKPLFYADWPSSTTSTNTANYNRCIYVAFCHGSDLMIYNDSADFTMGQIAPAIAAAIDTLRINADGDTVLWAVSPGSGADYLYVDESTPATDSIVLNNVVISGNKTEMFNLVDDTAYNGLDSCKLLVHARYGVGSEGVDNRILFRIDTAVGVSQPFRIGGFNVTSSWATYTSPNLPTLTKAQMIRLQVGVRDSTNSAGEEGDLHQVAWVALKRWKSAVIALDVWSDSLLKVGSVAAGVQRRNRIFLALRNTDSIGYYNPNGVGWYDSLALLRIMVDSISPAVTRYLTARMINPANLDDTTVFAIKGAAANNAAYAHSNWMYWSSNDTTWGLPGADSAGLDWYNADFDSFAVSQHAVITVDITDWVRRMNDAPNAVRPIYSGLILLAAREDSAANAWVKLGNVQPFANVDSSWIEIYRVATDRVPAEGAQGLKWFGAQSSGSVAASLENIIRGGRYLSTTAIGGTVGTGIGIADSIIAYISFSGNTVPDTCKAALYTYSAGTLTRVDTTAQRVFPIGAKTSGYYSFALLNHPAISTSYTYDLCAWCKSNGAADVVNLLKATIGSFYMDWVSLAYAAWPASQMVSSTNSFQLRIYCWYTEAATGTNKKKRFFSIGAPN